jgi:hypothetical protein
VSDALSLSPVSVGIYYALTDNTNVAGYVGTRVYDDLPENPTFPCVLISLSEDQQLGGFGTKPGHGNLPEVRLRIYVFTQTGGMKTAQDITDAILVALADPPDITASGFTAWAIFHDATTPVPDSLIAGQKVQELVTDMRLYVEKQ